MKSGLILLVALVALGCKTTDIERYESGKEKVAKAAEKICPDVAAGIGASGFLADMFAGKDEELDNYIVGEVNQAASALCVLLQGMKAAER